jgi:hypothetical protein
LAASALASLPPYSRGYLVMYNDMPSYAISQATRDVLTALWSITCGGDVLLYAFVLRTTNQLSTVLDSDLSQWLSQRNVKGVAPDLANRKVNIVQFTVASNRLQPQTTITSLPMPETMADILTRVLAT